MSLPAYFVTTRDAARPVQLTRAALEEIKRQVVVETTNYAPFFAETAHFTPGLTGSSVRSVQSKLRDIWNLRDFGVTGDGSAADGARIRTAIERAATDKLALVFPPSPTTDGWLIADGAPITGASDFALIGAPGAILGKPTSANYPLLRFDGCSNFIFDGLSLRGRESGHVVLENCANVLFRRMRNTAGGIQLFDGTRQVLFDDCWWTGTGSPTIQIGRSNQHPAGDPISDVTIRACRFIGTLQEPIDMQNKPQRILVDGCWFIDCNTVANEEALDIGGGEAEDIVIRDCFFDNTGTLSSYVVSWNTAINVKVEYAIRPKRVRIIRPTIRLRANTNVNSYGISCEADGYEIIGGEITGDVAYGLNLGGNGIGRVAGIRLIGQRTYGVRVRSNARAILRDIYAEVQAGGSSIVADSSAWADAHGEFVGGAYGVRFNTSAAGCRASGIFRNQTTAAFDAVSSAAGASLSHASITDAAIAVRLAGADQSATGITATGSGSVGVNILGTATRARVSGTVSGYTTAVSDAGSGSIIDLTTDQDTRYQPFTAGLFGAIATPLIARGEIIAASLTRAQGGGAKSTTLGSDGVTWAEVNADIARFYGAAQRLRREGARTNGVRNPRCEGAVTGTPGTLPTNWTLNAATGLTREVVGSGVANGLPYVDIRVYGTPTATTGQLIAVETANGVPASSGQTWTSSASLALVGGSTTGLTNLRWNVAATNGTSPTESSSTSIISTISGTLQRFTTTRTLNNAGTTNIRAGVEYNYSSGVPIDFTVRIAAPQMEQALFASTPILPPVGTPGDSTRGADLITAALSDLGIAATGASVWIGEAMIPQAAPAGVDQIIWQMDDGTDNNRIALVNPTGGLTLVLRRTTGGVTVSSASLGTVTAGTAFNLGLAVDGAGRAVARLNTGAMQAVTGCVTSGLTTARCGDNASGTSPLFGELGTTLVSPDILPDRVFAALVAAGPRPLRYQQLAGRP